MPPPLATLLTIVFLTVLLWRDSRQQPTGSAARWIAVAWFFVVGSKFLSQWLDLFGIHVGAASQEDGSPIDAAFFFLLLLAGAAVLVRRRVSIATFARNNPWLVAFMVYGLLSISWSDFPVVAMKRWIKTLGHPIMALVVLTDADPRQALRTVMARSGYLMLTLSVLFIKYYPEFGRSFDLWTGAATNAGIMNNKNELGYSCMLFGLFFFWRLLSTIRNRASVESRLDPAIVVAFLVMVWWLLSMADSATSLSCLILGGTTMIVVSWRMVSKRFLGTVVVVGVCIAAALVASGAYDAVVRQLGRNPNLTDRTAVWGDVLEMSDSPVLGTGFESFWLGDRLDRMWTKWWWHPIQAHNGYIETYINLGGVGIFLLATMLIATFFKAKAEMLRDLDFGRFRLGVLLAVIVYNYTEATFKGVHLVWTMFYLITIDYPLLEAAAVPGLDAMRAGRWGLSAGAARTDAALARTGRA
jgi:exopolysaccharide production protein ExoQ